MRDANSVDSGSGDSDAVPERDPEEPGTEQNLETDPSFVALTPDERRLALTAGRLFGVMAAKAGQESPHPLRAVPFEGGVAVFRAVRVGGMILVRDDESVMFRASSYTFDRALEEFSAGERTQVESFGRG